MSSLRADSSLLIDLEAKYCHWKGSCNNYKSQESKTVTNNRGNEISNVISKTSIQLEREDNTLYKVKSNSISKKIEANNPENQSARSGRKLTPNFFLKII